MTFNFKMVNGDVTSSGGILSRVVDLEKANQALLRMLTIAAPKGAGVDDLVGRVPRSSFELTADLAQNASVGFERMKRTQQIQRSARTPEETFIALTRVEARLLGQAPGTIGPTSVDPTSYRLVVEAQVGHGETARVGGTLLASGSPGASPVSVNRASRVTLNPR